MNKCTALSALPEKKKQLKVHIFVVVVIVFQLYFRYSGYLCRFVTWAYYIQVVSIISTR